jgi:hypothetical protein
LFIEDFVVESLSFSFISSVVVATAIDSIVDDTCADVSFVFVDESSDESVETEDEFSCS